MNSSKLAAALERLAPNKQTQRFLVGFCQAQVVEGESVICFAYDNPELVDQIKSLASFSFITFRWDDEGNCTYIGSSTQSQYIPSKKFKN